LVWRCPEELCSDDRSKVLHRDDTEWLLANPKQARFGNFPDHPGRSDVCVNEVKADDAADDKCGQHQQGYNPGFHVPSPLCLIIFIRAK